MPKPVIGWLLPSGQFLECAHATHLGAALECSEVPESITEFVTIERAGLDALSDECSELSERGEHPEWHRYETASDDLRIEIRNKLLDAEFIRIGTWHNTVHFEGRPAVLTKHKRRCIEFAKDRGLDYCFEPQKGK